MARLFGTDGVRGVANQGLTPDLAFQLGFAAAHVLAEDKPLKKTVLVGRDTRISGEMLESALVAGLCSAGADAIVAGVVSTPGVAWLTRSLGCDAGAVISASHNPFEYNGIKFFSREGYKCPDDVEDEIEASIRNFKNEAPRPVGKGIGRRSERHELAWSYAQNLLEHFGLDLTGMKIGLDCANGASFMIAKNVFDALGAETYVINNKPNGVNINRDAGSTHIHQLVEFVKSEGLDVGFAFDGDADRCIAVDNNGEVVDGDAILYIAGNYLKDRGQLQKNMVVTTVMSNFGLYKALEASGIDYIQTKVGDKFVAKELMDHGYSIGGEQSGHIIFSKYATTGDGILTAIRLAEIMVEEKTDLASLHAPLKAYPQVLENVRVKDKKTVLHNDAVLAAIDRVKTGLGEEGRTLVRPSGTEPVLRVMAEHLDPDVCQQAVDDIVEAISQAGLLA